MFLLTQTPHKCRNHSHVCLCMLGRKGGKGGARFQESPGRCSCLMATKVVALLGKSLSGKVREPATGAVGLPSLCAPVATSSALNLLSTHSGLSMHSTISRGLGVPCGIR